MYFKEFGSTRDLHKKTAVWAKDGQRLQAAQRATEIIHFTVIPDAHTPYGVPRWIMQTPSVLGSRKAEEFNLDFFDNGGVPPVMIVLQGGVLQAATRQAIQQMNSGPAAKNNRVQVLEVEPTGGGLNQSTPPQARVTVERFGADRQKDGMFETYDEKCEERVRRAFRLPQMFLGQSKDYNFATAFASYTVAEAQVFKPERDMFDEIISLKLLTAMGYDGYRLRSRPLVIEDATLKLQGIEVVMGMGDQVEPSDVVTEVNNITGTKLKVSDAAPKLAEKIAQQKAAAMGGQPGVGGPTGQAAGGPMAAGPNQPIKPINPQPKSPTGLPTPGSPTRLGGQPGQIKPKQVPTAMGGNQTTPLGMAARKSDDVQDLALKAVSALKALRKRDFSELAVLLPTINALDPVSRETFEAYVADLSFIDTSFDPVGLATLASATMDVMSTCGHQHGGGSE